MKMIKPELKYPQNCIRIGGVSNISMQQSKLSFEANRKNQSNLVRLFELNGKQKQTYKTSVFRVIFQQCWSR